VVIVVQVNSSRSIVLDLYRVLILGSTYCKQRTVVISVRPRFAREHAKCLWYCSGHLINIAPVCGRTFEIRKKCLTPAA
jgi:hypothetical protein